MAPIPSRQRAGHQPIYRVGFPLMLLGPQVNIQRVDPPQAGIAAGQVVKPARITPGKDDVELVERLL